MSVEGAGQSFSVSKATQHSKGNKTLSDPGTPVESDFSSMLLELFKEKYADPSKSALLTLINTNEDNKEKYADPSKSALLTLINTNEDKLGELQRAIDDSKVVVERSEKQRVTIENSITNNQQRLDQMIDELRGSSN